MIENDTQPKSTFISRAFKRFDISLHKQRFNITLTALVVAFAAVLFWDLITVAVYPGYQGVYWSRFFGGTRTWKITEGTNFKLPWDDIVLYDMRSHELHDTSTFLTKDGLDLTLSWSARYRIVANRLPELNQTIGPNYVNVIVYPEIVDAVRLIVGRYRADEIYASIEGTLRNDFKKEISLVEQKLPINYEEVMILKLELPAQISKGIENKLIAEQSMLTYVFRINLEEQERKRKQIEAAGIKDFENTSGISILKWRGLEVTAELAKSQNSKIILMGTDEKSLPLLLNTDK